MTSVLAAAALLAAVAKDRPVTDGPHAGLPTQVYYGEELRSPFLPVLPPASPSPTALTWVAAPASLVMLGADGSVRHELGVGRYSSEDGSLRREMRGAAAKDGRSAWHWQKVGNDDRTSSVLIFLGAHGQILERLDGVDAPEGLPPAALSADGAVLLAAHRVAKTWSVAAYSLGGKVRARVDGAHRIAALSVSEDGRRALVAWAGLDLPLMVTLFDLASGERRDIPADGLPAGPWTLSPDGTLLAAGRPVTRLP